MTIIKKHFDRKPTEKELSNFVAELIISNKGGLKLSSFMMKKTFQLRSIQNI